MFSATAGTLPRAGGKAQPAARQAIHASHSTRQLANGPGDERRQSGRRCAADLGWICRRPPATNDSPQRVVSPERNTENGVQYAMRAKAALTSLTLAWLSLSSLAFSQDG